MSTLREYLLQKRDALLARRALLPIDQTDEVDPLRHAGEADHREEPLDERRLAEDFLHALDVVIRVRRGRALGRDAQSDDGAAVLDRREFAPHEELAEAALAWKVTWICVPSTAALSPNVPRRLPE